MTEGSIEALRPANHQVFQPVPTNEDMRMLRNEVSRIRAGRARLAVTAIFLLGVVIAGEAELGDHVHIGPYTVLRNVRIGAGTHVESHCVLDTAVIGRACRIGPFARLRPEAHLADQVHVGNFVEIKKSSLGQGSKANHLAYLGDARIGSGVNIGAGVITCNYDGVNKHPTVIGDGAFIGTDTQLIAPVTIGAGAYIAAGSSIAMDAPAGQLTICRARDQRALPGWKRPKRTSGRPKGGWPERRDSAPARP